MKLRALNACFAMASYLASSSNCSYSRIFIFISCLTFLLCRLLLLPPSSSSTPHCFVPRSPQLELYVILGHVQYHVPVCIRLPRNTLISVQVVESTTLIESTQISSLRPVKIVVRSKHDCFQLMFPVETLHALNQPIFIKIPLAFFVEIRMDVPKQLYMFQIWVFDVEQLSQLRRRWAQRYTDVQ